MRGMTAMSDGLNGFTTKEIVARIWDDLKETRKDLTAQIEVLREDVAALKEQQAEGSTGRKIGGYVIQAVTTLLVGSLMALILAPRI